MRRAVAVAALLAGLTLPASSWAGAVPGARYEGRVADGTRSQITVSKNGLRLSSYDLYSKARCTDGERHEIGLLEPFERPVLIRADGTFSYRSRPIRIPLLRANGWKRQRRVLPLTKFSGQFDPTGDVVRGTVRTVFTARHFSCDTGEDSFTLYRQGTPQAPFRSATIASGRYRFRGRSLRGSLQATPFGPAIPRIALKYRVPCRRGGSYSLTFSPYRASFHGTRFAVKSAGPYRYRRYRVVGSDRVAGRFFYRNGYRLTGVLRSRQVFYRRGRRFDVCRGVLRFTGRFLGGPVGPEGPHPGH